MTTIRFTGLRSGGALERGLTSFALRPDARLTSPGQRGGVCGLGWRQVSPVAAGIAGAVGLVTDPMTGGNGHTLRTTANPFAGKRPTRYLDTRLTT